MVRGVFTADEVAALLADTVVMHAEARPGDGRSWWGRNASGEEVLCRVLDANRFARFRALSDDPRIRRLVALAPEDLHARDLDALDSGTVLWKVPDVTEGLADLPWHRDCGMGGHARNCPTVIVTICLTEGTAGAGELRALPGSHRGGYPFIDGRDTKAPDGVPLTVTAGDVSLHYTDVMHASLPPTSAEGPHRVSALLAFVPPAPGTTAAAATTTTCCSANPTGRSSTSSTGSGAEAASPPRPTCRRRPRRCRFRPRRARAAIGSRATPRRSRPRARS